MGKTLVTAQKKSISYYVIPGETTGESKDMEKYSMDGGSYDGSYYGNSRAYSRDGYYYDGGGMSGRRGRDRMGRFVSRDASEMARKLREMMEEAPDENTKREIERLASKMESM